MPSDKTARSRGNKAEALRQQRLTDYGMAMDSELRAWRIPRLDRIIKQWIRWGLNVPIFYKILVANALLVTATGIAGVLVTWRYFRVDAVDVILPLLPWAVVGGSVVLLLALVVNYAVLSAALQPFSSLHTLTEALGEGRTHARAEYPVFGDAQSNKLIETANGLLDQLGSHRQQIRGMSHRVTEQLEKGMKNISQELHDDTAQNLAYILLLQKMMGQQLDSEQRIKTLSDMENLTQITLEGVRRLSVGLQPTVLHERGFADALRWYVKEVIDAVLPNTILRVDSLPLRLSGEAELAMYRIAQEVLSNVTKHAGANSVTITFGIEGHEVVLRIADDGVGFDAKTVLPQSNQLGLFTIRERAMLAGGVSEIYSTVGQGTTVVVRFDILTRYAALHGSTNTEKAKEGIKWES